MTNSRSTKNALISSILVLALCFSMLLGTTFAWFTDTAASNDNKVVSGTLDVELWQHTGTGENDKVNISDSHDALFTDSILWEPNRTEVVYLSIRNNGSLALKYKVALDVTVTSDVDLTEVMEYDIIENAQYGSVTEWANDGTAVEPGLNGTQAVDVKLLPGAVHYFALAVHMDKDAGNQYQKQSIEFDIKVLAGQATEESGAFGNGYDANAIYPAAGNASAPIDTSATTQELVALDENGRTVASFVIPKDAAATGATGYNVKVTQDNDYNYAVESGKDATTYDVVVEGIKDNNDAPIKVTINYIPGLDPLTVEVYHKNETAPIASTYDPASGYVIFYATEFSPYTIVADVASVYVAANTEGAALPVAKVTLVPDKIAEANAAFAPYGLDVVYQFACSETVEQAELSPYANWHCDFYVKLDRALAAEQIYLGGNYGEFGWIGFSNADITLQADEEIPLLGSVTEVPWTYLQVVQNVGTFLCGVSDIENALEDATFTVMLRLTNPDDPTEYYNVSVINYTFDSI